MKTKYLLPSLLALLLSVQSCTTSQFGGAVTGSSLGGLFGSAIGGIVGGPRGSHIGTLVGMTAGGVAGASIAQAAEESQTRQMQPSRTYTDEVTYTRAKSPYVNGSQRWRDLQVSRVHFAGADDDRALGAGEQAYISFDIHNMSDETLYDVAPQVMCDNKHVSISPTAIITSIPAGATARYKAAVRANHRLRNGQALFSVRFGTGQAAYTAKTFAIDTRR